MSDDVKTSTEGNTIVIIMIVVLLLIIGFMIQTIMTVETPTKSSYVKDEDFALIEFEGHDWVVYEGLRGSCLHHSPDCGCENVD